MTDTNDELKKSIDIINMGTGKNKKPRFSPEEQMINENAIIAKAIDDNPWNAFPWRILQDVLAIHEIDEDNYTLRYAGNDNQVEYETCQCGDDYPCSTRTAIIKRLGGME